MGRTRQHKAKHTMQNMRLFVALSFVAVSAAFQSSPVVTGRFMPRQTTCSAAAHTRFSRLAMQEAEPSTAELVGALAVASAAFACDRQPRVVGCGWRPCNL